MSKHIILEQAYPNDSTAIREALSTLFQPAGAELARNLYHDHTNRQIEITAPELPEEPTYPLRALAEIADKLDRRGLYVSEEGGGGNLLSTIKIRSPHYVPAPALNP